MAVLRNGLFDRQSQQEFQNAVLQEQSNSGDDHPAGHDKQKLSRKAAAFYTGEQLSIPVRSNSGFTLSCMNIFHEHYGAAWYILLFHWDCRQPMSEPT